MEVNLRFVTSELIITGLWWTLSCLRLVSDSLAVRWTWRSPHMNRKELTYSICISQSIDTLRLRLLTVSLLQVSVCWNAAEASSAPGDEKRSYREQIKKSSISTVLSNKYTVEQHKTVFFIFDFTTLISKCHILSNSETDLDMQVFSCRFFVSHLMLAVMEANVVLLFWDP